MEKVIISTVSVTEQADIISRASETLLAVVWNVEDLTRSGEFTNAALAEITRSLASVRNFADTIQRVVETNLLLPTRPGPIRGRARPPAVSSPKHLEDTWTA